MVLLLALAQAHAATYLAVDASTDQLIAVDTVTQAATVWSQLGFSYDFGDAAYDDSAGIYYVVQARPNPSLWAFDIVNQTSSFIGALNVNEIFAADVEPTTGDIIAIQNSTTSMYRIDPRTAATTFIGNTGVQADGGYWDDARGGLVVNQIGAQTYFFVNLRGVATQIASNGAFTDNNDFDLDPDAQIVFSMDWSTNWYGYNGATFALQRQGITALRSDAGAIIDATPPSRVSLNVLGGGCPGPVHIEVTGLTPGGQVALARGRTIGSFTLQGAACRGTELDLTRPRMIYQATVPANGTLSIVQNLGPAACGGPIQAIDLTSCDVSNVWTP